VSHRRAPVDEVIGLVDLYRREHGGERGYAWVKLRLQEAGAVARAEARGKHRRRRERAPLPGMLVHQDGSTHEWVPGQWRDLIVTMDDATGEHCSMFFYQQEHGLEPSRDRPYDRPLRAVLRTVQRPWQPLLSHPRG